MIWLLVENQLLKFITENYNSKFQSFRSKAESQELKFKSNNSGNYNNLFSMHELTDAIS